MLGGKFRLLEKFIDFLQLTKKSTVSEDTWRQARRQLMKLLSACIHLICIFFHCIESEM